MKKALVISKPEPSFFPYTKAIAMKNGWTFEIPLQHRTGRGYIFDSDYIDENKAHEEVEQFYKQDVEVQKVISFDAGRMQNAWVNNCIAIGLAQSFRRTFGSYLYICNYRNVNTFKTPSKFIYKS